jgi:hypothetical protein
MFGKSIFLYDMKDLINPNPKNEKGLRKTLSYFSPGREISSSTSLNIKCEKKIPTTSRGKGRATLQGGGKQTKKNLVKKKTKLSKKKLNHSR